MAYRRWGGAAAALAVVTTVAGCNGSSAVDRTGADTVVLRLATSDGLVKTSQRSYAPVAFVEELENLSGGRIRVEMTTDYGAGAPDAESQLVRAIASGEVDGGYPATRAFSDAGITGLEAVEAPFTLTNQRAVEELVNGPGGELALSSLDGTGVVGLALAAAALRTPFSAGDPLLSPADWDDVRFRVYNSPVQSATVEALGGTPVSLSHSWDEAMRSGALDGVELDVAGYAEGAGTEARHVTVNAVLWPKVFVLALSQKRYDTLSDEQRRWVREAAARAGAASFAGSWDDTDLVRSLCERGVDVRVATDEQLAKLKAAVAPVVRSLSTGEGTSALMEHVAAAAEKFPDPVVPEVPENCASTGPEGEPGGGKAERSGLPDGVYRVEIPVSAVEAAGFSNGPGWSGTWTLLVEDGAFALTCQPVDDPGKDCGGTVSDQALEAGLLVGETSSVTFVSDTEEAVEAAAKLTGCEPPSSSGTGTCPQPLPAYSATWELSGDELRFTDPAGNPSHLVINPWRRIG